MAVLPNFFLVGATKAGTTSLYHYLDQHPQIYMSPIKEPCYFASEVRPSSFADQFQEEVRESLRSIQKYLSGPMRERRFSGLVLEWDDYLKLYQNHQGEPAIGEASVCYLWSKTAAANIASRIPGARIIVILRDPADRAYSQYLDSLTGGRTLKSFREHVELGMARTDPRFDILHPFLELGSYHDQVKRYLECFPKENIRIYWYEDYRGDIAKILPDVFRFLNVDAAFVPDASRKHRAPRVPKWYKLSYFLKQKGLWQPLRRSIPPVFRPAIRNAVLRKRESLVMDPRDRELLIGYYREDIRKLSTLLDRDLSPWLEVNRHG